MMSFCRSLATNFFKWSSGPISHISCILFSRRGIPSVVFFFEAGRFVRLALSLAATGTVRVAEKMNVCRPIEFVSLPEKAVGYSDRRKEKGQGEGRKEVLTMLSCIPLLLAKQSISQINIDFFSFHWNSTLTFELVASRRSG